MPVPSAFRQRRHRHHVQVRALLKILEADNPKLTNILPPGGRNRLFGLEDSNRLVVFPLTGC